MDEKIIGRIIEKVFKKAKKEHASHSKFALSNHISTETDLSSRTLERLYDRYIEKNGKHGPPNADSIDLLCKYLGFENYAGYIKRHPTPEKTIGQKKGNTIHSKWITFSISIAFTIGLIIFGIQKWSLSGQVNNIIKENCMTWADSIYVAVACDQGPFSKFGTEVKPMNQMELSNMKKVEVDAAYPFFSEDGKPLVWYYKNKDNKREYFTAPGLHPISGETLRKITPYIIQTYVPVHSNNEESFIN